MLMRIGIVTYALDRPLGGISRYTVEMITALARLDPGPEIILFAAGGPGPLARQNPPFTTIRLPGCRLLPGLMVLGNILLPPLARRCRVDIVHDPTGVTPFAFGAGGARRIVSVYDTIPWSYPGVSTRLDSWIYRYWLPRVLPHVDSVVTCSIHSKNDLIRYLRVKPSQVNVVYAAANARYRPTPLTEALRSRYHLPDPYILFLGSVEERKNLKTLLKAYALLKQRGIRDTLVIAGSKLRKYAVIEQTLRALGLEDDVVFTGYVDEPDLPAIYSGAELFVFPSLYEGFGLPVLEAMACGTPVITSTSSSLPEVAGEAALLVDPYRADALADAIQQVVADPVLRQAMRRKSLERAQEFHWDRTARQVHAVYESVLTN